MNIFSLYNTNQQLVLPIDLEIMIPENDSVRLLSTVLEGLDYSELYNAYSTNGRNPAISPKTLFMVLVYANLNDIQSSRDIEKACKRDVNFMWLLQGKTPPSYSTIARFRTGRLKECCENLFYQLVVNLGELGEIDYKNIFVDGTKIEANSNKYSFVWKKSVNKFEKKLKEKMSQKISELNKEFIKCYATDSASLNVILYSKILQELQQIVTEKNIEFVSGKGKRKSTLQKYIELLYDAIEKQKTKKFKSDISKRENMDYDLENDEYICASGRKLKNIGLIERTSKSGYISEVTKYECESCEGCSIKNKCTKAKGNRQIQVSKKFVEKTKISLDNITTPKGIVLRMNRSIQVEGTFGVVKQDHGFRRFLLRGSINVRIEFLLKAISHNIAKLHTKITQNRLGCSLFKKELVENL